MAKYSKAAGRKVETAMKEMKKGSLKTGSGKKVTDQKQAVAIGLSEAKKKGLKVPAKKTAAPKNAAAKKTAPVKKAATPKKTGAKNLVPAKKAAVPTKASSAKKAPPAKKAAPVKKSSTPKKTAPTKKAAAPKKAMTKKTATAKKVAASKKSAPAASSVAKPSAAIRANKQGQLSKSNRVVEKKKPAAPPSPEMNYPPVEENSPMEAPVQEPNPESAILNEQKVNPAPEDKYAVARDTYHGHTKPTASKSKIKPAGKKPLY